MLTFLNRNGKEMKKSLCSSAFSAHPLSFFSRSKRKEVVQMLPNEVTIQIHRILLDNSVSLQLRDSGSFRTHPVSSLYF